MLNTKITEYIPDVNLKFPRIMQMKDDVSVLGLFSSEKHAVIITSSNVNFPVGDYLTKAAIENWYDFRGTVQLTNN